MPIVVEAVSVEDYLTWIDQTAATPALIATITVSKGKNNTPFSQTMQNLPSKAILQRGVGGANARGKESGKMQARLDFQYFPFHMVDPSPWPILLSFSLLNLTISAVLAFHGYAYGGKLLSLGFILTSLGMLLWFKDILTEATHLGHHTSQVQNGLTLGFYLFVISEIFAFASVFWSFFHSALAPTIEIGGQ